MLLVLTVSQMKENKNSDKNIPASFSSEGQSQLILYNDEINTFQYVIDTLIEICDYDEIQAEQLATIAHYSGKVVIKTGNILELQKISEEFISLGINAKVQ